MNRRDMMWRSVLGLTAVGGAMLAAPRRLPADEPVHIAKDDPMAKAAKYVDDAGQSARKNPAAFCHTCRFFKGSDKTSWAACEMFSGKAVNANGWCSMWAKKA